MEDKSFDIATEKYFSTQDATTHDQLRPYPKLVKMQVAAISTDSDGDPVAQMTHPQDDPANPRPFWPLRGTAVVNDWLWVFLIEGNGIVMGDVGGGSGGGISGIIVQEDGVQEAASATTLNFTTGMDVSASGSTATISSSGGGGSGVTVQDDGVQEGTGITTLNFSSNLDASISGSTATITGQAGGGSGAATGAFAASVGSDLLNTAGSTDHLILYNNELWDVSGWWSTANCRYTPQIAGYYRLSAYIVLSTSETDGYMRLSIRKNGSEQIRLGQSQSASGSLPLAASGSQQVYANGSTDYFEFILWHDFSISTTDILTNTAHRCTGEFIGT